MKKKIDGCELAREAITAQSKNKGLWPQAVFIAGIGHLKIDRKPNLSHSFLSGGAASSHGNIEGGSIKR